MTGCERTQLYLDGRLSAAEREAAEAHLSDCAACASLVNAWRGFSSAFAQVSAPLRTAPQRSDVEHLLRKSEPVARRVRWPLMVPVAVVGVALLAVAVVWSGGLPTRDDLLPILLEGQNGSVEVASPVLDAPMHQAARYRVGGDFFGVGAGGRVVVTRRHRSSVRLRLERGAVAVAAAHRPRGASFVVEAGGLEVVVVGTRFRVAHFDTGILVEVLAGAVRVNSTENSTDGGAVDVPAGRSMRQGRAGLAAVSVDDFAELTDAEERPAGTLPGPADDAGRPEDGVAGSADGEEQLDGVGPAPGGGGAAEPSRAQKDPRPSSAPHLGAELERWRRLALAGDCHSVLLEIRRKLGAQHRWASVWRIEGDCLRLASRDGEAAAAYRRVIRHGELGEGDRARLLLTDLVLKAGDSAEAERLLRAFLSHQQPKALEAAARLKLARALLLRGNSADARTELLHVVEQLPASPSAVEAKQLLDSIRP